MFNRVKMWFSSFYRKRQAKRYRVPFREKMWYNFMAFVPKEERDKSWYIEIFDEKGEYINCPKIGGVVVCNFCGVRYQYVIVDFKNSNRYSDWLYDNDYINPVCEFVKKL